MLTLFRRLRDNHRREAAKEYWRQQRNPCANAARVFEALTDAERQELDGVIEFGASWGGNLQYFMDRLPRVRAVGIDVNPIVADLSTQYPAYRGIVGDERALAQFRDQEFDLGFTVSVLDHLPSDVVVEDIVGQLLRIAKRVILLEPFVEGVHADVSNKTRDEVKPGLERGQERFKAFCYLWNYDRMLDRRGARWTKTAAPLHPASLGPFYHLYRIASPVALGKQATVRS